jgi:hypothetical protein
MTKRAANDICGWSKRIFTWLKRKTSLSVRGVLSLARAKRSPQLNLIIRKTNPLPLLNQAAARHQTHQNP